MTDLRRDTLTLEAAGLGPENPLPRFRGPESHIPLPVKVDLPADVQRDYGRNQAERVLPHRLQDGYDRQRRVRSFNTLVLENEHLKAEFVPEWGGRLWSLYDKTEKRELLHRNPVFQPANLALRQAWISGGIEWNPGRLGHHDYTLSPLFAARIEGPAGVPVLRFYEWDRVGCFPWQIDFHLPPDSRFLWARMRLVNPHDHPLSNYWWTNIAVDERPDTRVLAPADAYLGYRPDQTLAFVDYPKTADGLDVSYTAKSPRPCEHFFRIAPESRKWVACVGGDGRGFVQASTGRLRGRKCFAWGTEPRAKRWQEFLGGPSSAYLEIQAGLATSQIHSVTLPPGAAWAWTEAFGPMAMDAAAAHDSDYGRAWRAAERALEGRLPRAAVEAMEAALAPVTERAPAEILHEGSGWGALERRRLKADGQADRIPAELVFADTSMGPDQAPWRALLETGGLPERDPALEPGAFLVQPEWRQRLEAALAAGRGDHAFSWFHLGVMRMEVREPDGAVEAWIRSMRAAPSCWAARCLAVAAERAGRAGDAILWLERAWAIRPDPLAGGIAVELMQAYNRAGRYLEALELAASAPAAVRERDRFRLEVVRAQILTDRFDGLDAFFRTEFPALRECEQSVRDLWFLFCERRLAQQERLPMSRELQERVRKECPPPREVDFA